MFLYCIFYKEEMIAMFHSEKKAINQMTVYQLDGLRDLTIKKFSAEEYKNYYKKILKNIDNQEWI